MSHFHKTPSNSDRRLAVFCGELNRPGAGVRALVRKGSDKTFFVQPSDRMQRPEAAQPPRFLFLTKSERRQRPRRTSIEFPSRGSLLQDSSRVAHVPIILAQEQ